MKLEEIVRKSNWDLKKISDVTFYQEGPGVRKKQYTEEGVKLLNVGNIQKGKIDLSLTDRYISEEEAYGKYEHFLADEGDLIIACSGIQVSYFHEKIAFLKKEHLPLCMNTSTMRFKSLDEGILDINYFSYFLKTNYFKKQLQKLITGSAQLNFGPSHIEQIDIMLPPIKIQKKIVEVLDEAQKLIDNRKKQIELLDDLIESIFYDMFGDPVKNNRGWEVKKLGELTSKIGSGSTPRGGESSYKKEGISLIRSMNIYDGEFVYDGLAFIDEGQASKLNNVIVLEGDVLINITGASINRACIVPKDILPARVNQHVSILRPKKDLTSNYLVNLLISKTFKRKLYNIATSGGATREAITKGDLENLEIPIPPLPLQNQFANKVQAIESQKQLLEKSLKLLEDNYNSLMQRSFKGELF